MLVIPLITVLTITCLICLPIRTCINKSINSQSALQDETLDYKETAAEIFMEDYDRANPVTKKDGVTRHLDMKKNALEERMKNMSEKERAEAQAAVDAMNAQKAAVQN